MRALVHRTFGDETVPDCKKCEGEPRLRPQYGCDGPATLPVFAVTCSACSGIGCERCVDGAREFFRCPGRLTEHRRDILSAFWYCVQYEQNALMPGPGGLADQTSSWLSALRVYQAERAVIEKENQRKAELAALRAKRRG